MDYTDYLNLQLKLAFGSQILAEPSTSIHLQFVHHQLPPYQISFIFSYMVQKYLIAIIKHMEITKSTKNYLTFPNYFLTELRI